MGYAVSPVYQIAPGGVLAQQLSFVAYGVTISNLTNQWLFIDSANEWVPPYVSGRNVPLNGAQQVSAHFNAPTGFTNPTPIPGQLAYLRASEQPLLSTPGLPVAPGIVRWVISHRPGVGVQASVTKAASPGVVHVGDLVIFRFLNNSSAISVQQDCFLIDGISGGALKLISTILSLTVNNGDKDSVVAGPGMGIKGTAGNAMTIEFSAAIAGTYEAVNLVGYDA